MLIIVIFAGFRWCLLFLLRFLVAYLFKVYNSPTSYASSVMAHAALKWFHLFGLSNGSNLLDSSICHILLEAARRDKPVSVKKTPTSAEIIMSIIDEFGGPGHTCCLYLLVRLCRVFRYDELSSIAPMHLEFFPYHLRVFVPKAKNDIYCEGNYVYIKRLTSKYCPVTRLESYASVCNAELSSQLLFSFQLDYLSPPILISYMELNYHECFKVIGVDHKLYGVHSLTSVEATFAVSYNPNLSERILQLHGRWKFDTVK